MPESAIPPPPESICLLRLSALGDVTHAVPVLRAIQDHWPATKVTWIIGKLEHRMLGGIDGVEFLEFDKKGGWAAVRELRRQLGGRRFDVLLHMQVAARANLLSVLVKADQRIGWDRARSRDRHHWFVNRQVREVRFQHQVEGFLEFARVLGLPAHAPRWDLPVADADREWAAGVLPENVPLLMISPCSSHVLRNWRPEYYARVAGHAARAHGMQPVLIGGPGAVEHEMRDAILAHADTEVLDLVGKDTIRQSLALLERADLLISPDSGPVHMASALGTPVLGLYAATWSRRSGPWRSPGLCVDRFPEAARRFRGKAPEELRWGTRIEEPGVMDLVTPEDVIARLDEW
ncbi:MAG: glycosyltransferase family 9 protein, partial [Xanthomonadales bacterium]|nr:glycosyltransferase family 9 protein [Xanthomonadales bacterium]